MKRVAAGFHLWYSVSAFMIALPPKENIVPQEPIDRSFEEIRQLFRETDARLDRRIAETDARLDQRITETNARLAVLFQESRQQLAELEALFGGQWGRLLEALVKPGALRLFQERGIPVRRVHERSEARVNGESMEVDLILDNGDAIVVVEVKSRMRIADIDEFVVDLGRFTEFFPRYRGYRIYGAAATLKTEENASRYAYRRGLFVLSLGSDGLTRIENDASFRPRNFSQTR